MYPIHSIIRASIFVHSTIERNAVPIYALLGPEMIRIFVFYVPFVMCVCLRISVCAAVASEFHLVCESVNVIPTITERLRTPVGKRTE